MSDKYNIKIDKLMLKINKPDKQTKVILQKDGVKKKTQPFLSQSVKKKVIYYKYSIRNMSVVSLIGLFFCQYESVHI